jgi:DNA-nicking Smr family endonuclease
MSGEKETPPPSARSFARRRLTAEEEDLWSLVARTVKPLRHGRKLMQANHKGHSPDRTRSAMKKAASDRAIAASGTRLVAAPRPTSIAPREKQRLSRGRAEIDARIDLHGMTQAQAHTALLRFLHRAQATGAKFVLVITGKGAPDAPRGERGVLRRQVPLWLGLPEFRGCVLGFDRAHIGHGGEGALYVRLRKARG